MAKVTLISDKQYKAGLHRLQVECCPAYGQPKEVEDSMGVWHDANGCNVCGDAWDKIIDAMHLETLDVIAGRDEIADKLESAVRDSRSTFEKALDEYDVNGDQRAELYKLMLAQVSNHVPRG